MVEIQSILPGRLSGCLAAPPSKSITHRALMLAAVSGEPCTVRNPLLAEDTRLTLEGLQTLGYECHRDEQSLVFSGRRRIAGEPVRVWVGASGTTARFLCALAAALPLEAEIDGTERMRHRPMAGLLNALRQLGAEIPKDAEHLPLRIRGGGLRGGRVAVESGQTSQYLSALLLAAPLMPGGLELQLSGKAVSRPYLDLTVEMLRRAGVAVETEKQIFRVPPDSRIEQRMWEVEGDFSSAAVFMAGTLISGGNLLLQNLSSDSLQGDRRIVEILAAVGGDLCWTPAGLKVRGGGELHGLDVELSGCPDLVPPLAMLALFVGGKSRLRGVGHLRFKESDRIAALLENIHRLGGRARAAGDHLIIEPQPLHGALLDGFDDHRMVMSFALAGLRVPGVRISGAECVAKSYPGFWDDFHRCLRVDTGGRG